ncbi:MAG: sporulation transcription factor Spo0A [Lachnospiraceae bacterium]|nr:sporulation transcription factor Spo0A [Lachnospiraceae bacterium]
MRIIIIVNSREEGKRISDYLERKSDIEIINVLYNGEEAYRQILSEQPDLIVMNIVLPGMDGLELMELLSTDLSIPKLPKVIAISSVDNITIMECACQLGVDFYMLKPYRLETLYHRIRQICYQSRKMTYGRNLQMDHKEQDRTVALEIDDYESLENFLNSDVTDVLRRVGMPAHIKGYQYIRTGIIMAVQDITILNYITKLLYPTIAKQYSTTPSSVERAIRHAIEVTWSRGNSDAIREIFCNTSWAEQRKPTNSEFIAQIADQFRVDYNIQIRA